MRTVLPLIFLVSVSALAFAACGAGRGISIPTPTSVPTSTTVPTFVVEPTGTASSTPTQGLPVTVAPGPAATIIPVPTSTAIPEPTPQKATLELRAAVSPSPERDDDNSQGERSAPSGNLSLPFRMEDAGGGSEFISPFGIIRHSRDSGYGHSGIDIPLNANAPIYAVADGTILSAEVSGDGAGGSDVKLLISGSGGEGWGFLYEHVALEPGITLGSTVTKGQLIARNGLTTDRRNNHFQLSYMFNEYTFYRDHRCWVDHLDSSSRKPLLDYFSSPETVVKLTARWEAASEEGMNAYKELLNRERFPEGPQLCYSLGLDVRVSAPVSPTPTPSPVSTLDFKGFTHMPVDFHAVLGATSTCTNLPRITPFFDYSNTNHAEGPKKWYITACPGDVVKVYLPAKGILHQWAIRAFGGEEGIEGHFNGEKVLINVQVLFDVSPEITVFYMHLTLRDPERRCRILRMRTSYSMRVLTLATYIRHQPVLFTHWTSGCRTRTWMPD